MVAGCGLLIGVVIFSIIYARGTDTKSAFENGCKSYGFDGFRTSVSDAWYASGTADKFFRNTENKGVYLLIGNSSSSDYEKDICENLELFEGTVFYRNEIAFIYEEKAPIGDDMSAIRINGTLKNNRNGEDLRFFGYFLSSPNSYIFAVGTKDDQKLLAAVTDEAFDMYEKT